MWVQLIFTAEALGDGLQFSIPDFSKCLVAATEQQACSSPMPMLQTAGCPSSVSARLSWEMSVLRRICLAPDPAAGDQPMASEPPSYLSETAELSATSKTSRPNPRKVPPARWAQARLRIDQRQSETYGMAIASREAAELSTATIPPRIPRLTFRQDLERKGPAGG